MEQDEIDRYGRMIAEGAKRQRDDKSSRRVQYPCHGCADTMIHGQTYTFPREYDATKPSCGKVYTNPAWASGAMSSYQQQLIECWRCKGTGWLSERRSFRRRNMATRRVEEASAPSSTAAPSEACSYCGVEYPKPIQYHHSEQECAENLKAVANASPVSADELESLTHRWHQGRLDAPTLVKKLEVIIEFMRRTTSAPSATRPSDEIVQIAKGTIAAMDRNTGLLFGITFNNDARRMAEEIIRRADGDNDK